MGRGQRHPWRGQGGGGACQELWLPGSGGAWGQAGGSTKAPTVVVLLLRASKLAQCRCLVVIQTIEELSSDPGSRRVSQCVCWKDNVFTLLNISLENVTRLHVFQHTH